jgi:hypothetical protein
VALCAVMVASAPAAAAPRHEKPKHASEDTAQRPAGDPIMAIVSLKNQRVTLYDADGWIQKAPVSSGQHGRETPAGVFSVIQKDADHHSNLYDDASMPHMQRITWSGIALHGGPLPGYAASHGCVRMPYGFAERIFRETKLGMRVIIAPHDVEPVDISNPTLFQPKPDAVAHAAQLAADAQAAIKKADEAKSAAAAANRDTASVGAPVRKLEALKARADAELAAADKAAGAAKTDTAKARAEDAKQKLTAKVAELQTQLDAAKAEVQPKLDAATAARDAATAAETARVAAVKASRDASLTPVSVFISRKTQKLYVRRGFEPIFDAPITIKDPAQPIGTHIFTAVAKTDTGLRWTAVTIDGGSDAKTALDRITIPQDVLDRIAPTAAARSSIIISDEALSNETGKGTEFVAVLSDQPQGGLAMRKHPSSDARYAREQFAPQYGYGYGYQRQQAPQNYWRPFGGGYSTW